MKSLINFKQVSFAWLKPDAPADPAERSHLDLEIIFDDFSVDLPPGMISVLGPNGVGKSTFLLLAGARLQALDGHIQIAGRKARDFTLAYQDPQLEDQRNQLVSFVYQNMEFETDHTLGELLAQLAQNLDNFKRSYLEKAPVALGLEDCLHLRPQEMAKGQLQRAVIAMSLYYGSPILIMDEPVFALEDPRKHQVFSFLRDYATHTGTSIIYTAHDFEICRDYATFSLLLWREQSVLHHAIGPTAEICAPDTIEKAYRAPMNTLFQKERLYRQMLLKKETDHD